MVRLEVLRFLFTLAAIYDLECKQMDVKTAFLNGKIDFKIFMEQIEGGFVSRESRAKFVCRLKRSLYGLKQSPFLWYWTFLEYMLSLGYTRLHKDRCVFILTTSPGFTIVSLYVDELLIFAQNKAMCNDLMESLSKRFKMKDLGDVKDILGWQITRDRKQRRIFIHQSRFCNIVLDRFNLLNCSPVLTPFESTVSLSLSQCPKTPEDILYMADKPYRSLVGSLMYLAMGSRPDLAYAIQQLSQFLHAPGKQHWTSAKRVLRYLKGSQTRGLVIGGRDSLSRPFLSAYVDANYAMCPDTRRCVSGFLVLFFGTPISWLSKKQPLVTLSTTEAELVALALCIQELLYMRQLAGELDQTSSSAIPTMKTTNLRLKLQRTPNYTNDQSISMYGTCLSVI